MNRFLELVENMLSDLRRSRVAAAPPDHTALAPVWAMPMVRRAEKRLKQR